MAHFDWCLYKREFAQDHKEEIEDYEEIFIATQEGEIPIEDVIEDYLRLKAEEKTAEEMVEKYVEEKISETLTDAPLDDPMHHSWDRYFELANHGLD